MDVPSPSGTRNLEAQNLFPQSEVHSLRNSSSLGIGNTLVLFKKATELDPSYAQAWAGQAYCYSDLGYGYLRYPKDVFPLAVQAMDRALSL